MSALSAMSYLFLNRIISAVPAGEPYHICMIIPVFSGSFADSFAKVLNSIENLINSRQFLRNDDLSDSSQSV